MKASLPDNETERLQALRNLGILDSDRENSYNDLVKLASVICQVPTAVISLVDVNRQWFKACIGLDATETPRDIAFCAHAILRPNSLLVVEDAEQDPRFADNPLVTGEPGIRFYAGAPLVTDTGEALGTLCVIDYQPNRLDDAQREALAALSRQVMRLLDLRAANKHLQRNAENLQFMSDSLPVLIAQLDEHRRYVFCNSKYREWYAIEPRRMLGKTVEEVVAPEIVALVTDKLERCYEGETVVFELPLPDGRTFHTTYAPQRENDRVVGAFTVAADITYQKKQQRALLHERESLDSVIKGANVGTWEWNVQTGETVFNERWAEIVGYTLAELAPISVKTWLCLAHPEDLKYSEQLLQKHFAGELDYYDCKCRMKHKAGHWVWVHARGRVDSFTPDGKPLFMFGTHADVTELQLFQDRLQENEERLQSMLSNFPGAVYRRENDARWTMHYLSDAAQQLTGYPAASFLGEGSHNFSDITHPDDLMDINRRVVEALAARQSFDLIYRIKRADGAWRWVEEMGAAVYDARGKVKYIDGFIWDVTETEESFKAIELNEKKLSTLYNLSPVAIALTRFEDGRFIEGNPELYRLTGYTREEFEKLNFWDITPNEYAAAERAQMDQMAQTGRYGPYEKRYIHKTGEQIPVLMHGALIESPSGEKQIWSIIQDITERKRIEQMKNEFVSAVSHELRTPLTSIMGTLGIVSSGKLGELPVKVQEMLEIANRNCKRLNILINDLLDMEKLLAGKMNLDLQRQALRPIIEQSLRDNKSYADTFSVRFVLKSEPETFYVAVDAQRLLQVMANFLSNAAKFSPKNAAVDIVLAAEKGSVKISVIDSGPGISENFRSQIFKKFSQADASDSRRRGGTGLGLSISKELVERMNGEIGFESEVGKGATFFARFPLV